MPIVPRYENPTVGPSQGSPSFQVRTPALPSQEFDARPFRRLDAEVGDFIEKAKEQASKTRLLEKRRALNDWEARAIRDPKTGAAMKTGRDAIGITDTLLEDYDKFAQQQLEDLSDEDQRIRFREMSDNHRNSILDWGYSHEKRQSDVAYEQEYGASKESSKRRAEVNPSKIQDEEIFLRDLIRGYAKDKGVVPEAASVEEQTQVSDLYTRAIRRKLRDRDYSGAIADADSYDSLLTEDDKARLFPAIESARIDSQVDSMFREISGFVPLGTPEGYAEAKKAADKVKDPKVQKLLLSKLSQERADILEQKRSSELDTAERLMRIAESRSGRPLTEIFNADDLAQLQALPSRERNAVKSRAAETVMTENANIEYLEFQRLEDTQIRELFSDSRDFNVFISQFDNETRQRATRRWESAIKNDDRSKFNNKIESLKKQRLILDEVIPADGKMIPGDFQKIKRFSDRVDDAVTSFTKDPINKGRLPNDEETKIIIDSAVKETLASYDGPIPLAKLSEDEILEITGRLGPKDVAASIKEIDQGVIDRIRGKILAARRKPTDELIVRLFRAAQLADPVLEAQILAQRDEE